MNQQTETIKKLIESYNMIIPENFPISILDIKKNQISRNELIEYLEKNFDIQYKDNNFIISKISEKIMENIEIETKKTNYITLIEMISSKSNIKFIIKCNIDKKISTKYSGSLKGLLDIMHKKLEISYHIENDTRILEDCYYTNKYDILQNQTLDNLKSIIEQIDRKKANIIFGNKFIIVNGNCKLQKEILKYLLNIELSNKKQFNISGEIFEIICTDNNGIEIENIIKEIDHRYNYKNSGINNIINARDIINAIVIKSNKKVICNSKQEFSLLFSNEGTIMIRKCDNNTKIENIQEEFFIKFNGEKNQNEFLLSLDINSKINNDNTITENKTITKTSIPFNKEIIITHFTSGHNENKNKYFFGFKQNTTEQRFYILLIKINEVINA